jgi:hypothetical protein
VDVAEGVAELLVGMARNISSVTVAVEIAAAGSWKSPARTPLLGKRRDAAGVGDAEAPTMRS